MLDRTCRLGRADGQSAVLSRTAASRTQDARYVADRSGVRETERSQGCDVEVAQEVSRLVASPRLDSVAGRAGIDEARDLVRAAVDDRVTRNANGLRSNLADPEGACSAGQGPVGRRA